MSTRRHGLCLCAGTLRRRAGGQDRRADRVADAKPACVHERTQRFRVRRIQRNARSDVLRACVVVPDVGGDLGLSALTGVACGLARHFCDRVRFVSANPTENEIIEL